ncbi:MAG: precorrin-6y C5,15-methyltransferase (decarboxylating) subunit CbiE [Pseudomonadota bacterium]
MTNGISELATKINVIGLGIEPGGRLNAGAEAALQSSQVMIGSERQLQWVNDMQLGVAIPSEQATLPPLKQLPELIDGYVGEVALLASGDPLYFGIGRWLGQHYASSRLQFYPALSSVQAACNRLGIALQDCTVISLHGRPLSSLRRHLVAGRTLIILTDQHSHPRALADHCAAVGLAQSTLWVCEQLGYPDERIQKIAVSRFDDEAVEPFSDLQVSVLQLAGAGGLIPTAPGIEDRNLVTDGEPGQGMITKREVRLQILSLLQLGADQVLWDVGAGCGGVSTETALWHACSKVIAVEQHPGRVQCLRANREKFGTTNLDIIEGRAPDALEGLPDPQRIFVGGNDGELEAMLALCWTRLSPGGRLVASAVTEATRSQLEQFAASDEFASVNSVQVAVSRGVLKAQQWQVEDKRPVTLFSFDKPGDSDA